MFMYVASRISSKATHRNSQAPNSSSSGIILNPVIEAQQHLRPMRGGAQSHLMFADDGRYYVVKFQNNPQHIRVLANELLASRIAERVGLPVPITEVMDVIPWLVENSPDLRIRAGSSP